MLSTVSSNSIHLSPPRDIAKAISDNNNETNNKQEDEHTYLLNHLREYEENFYNSNVNTRCPLENCPLHASSLLNLFANCITSNNLIATNNVFINGTLCLSGALQCSGCNLPTGPVGATGATGTTGATGAAGATGATVTMDNSYFFSYDTTSQAPTTVFTNVTFNTNGANDGNWSHPIGSSDFTALNAGVYLVDALLFYKEAPLTPVGANGNISSHVTVNNVEVAGSQSTLRMFDPGTGSGSTHLNLYNTMGRSIIITIQVGDILRVQQRQSSAPAVPFGFLAPDGTGATPVGISISIIRIN